MSPHCTTIAVRWAELDPYAHVNHAAYVTYLEVARTEALDAIDLPLQRVSEAGLQFVVVRIEVDYRKAAGVGDVLTVETALVSSRRATSTWGQRILRGDDVMITAAVTVAITDAEGRPVRPPAWIMEALEPLRLAPDDASR